MDASLFLKPGDQMDLEYEGNFCSTKISEVNGNVFIVDYLTTRGRPVFLTAGERYSMVQKTPHGLFFFDVRYNERITNGNLFYMSFTAISEPVKNQRRQTFRVPYDEPAKILLIGPFINTVILHATKVMGPRPQDLKKTWTETRIKDMSEDGLQIFLKDPYEINSHIFIMFELQETSIFANCVVRRHSYSANTVTQADMMGVQMLDLAEKELKLIRKYIMNYQIKMRAKASQEEPLI